VISPWHKFIGYTKKVVGTKLTWKQTCQIYLQRDENMEYTLAQDKFPKEKAVRTNDTVTLHLYFILVM